MSTKRKFEEPSNGVRKVSNEQPGPVCKKRRLQLHYRESETASVTMESPEDANRFPGRLKPPNRRNNLGERGALQRNAGKKTNEISPKLKPEVAGFKNLALTMKV